MKLEWLVQSRRQNVQRKILDVPVQRRLDVTTKAHAKSNGCAFIVINSHYNFAPVRDDNVHEEPWSSLEVVLGEAFDVFLANHNCCLPIDSATRQICEKKKRPFWPLFFASSCLSGAKIHN